MHPDLLGVADHIRNLALGALTHANWHANYFSHDNRYWNELSVIQAAHAMELFLKARIAEEHPLLIFNRTPKTPADSQQMLDIALIVEQGRTYGLDDLPDRLWAVTGIQIRNIDTFRSFGRLRNTIQHFTIPSNTDCGARTRDFIYSVIDPFINECWGYFAIDYNEDHEPYEYLVGGLISAGVYFLVSKHAADYVIKRAEWPSDAYRDEMLSRARDAVGGVSNAIS